MSIEAMKQALEALDIAHAMVSQWTNSKNVVFEAYKRLEQAIAEAEKQEPVAWREINLMGKWKTRYYDYNEDGRGEPLYTAPPKREWVGLTEQEIDQCYADTADELQFYQAIKAKLKERNG